VTTPPTTAPQHLFSVLVENKSGVLVRVAGLFARRGFNIVSLAVAPTDDERFSKMSIVVDAESAPLQQVRDQLDKLVNVVEITEIAAGQAHEAELLLVSVRSGATVELTAVLERHGARVLAAHAGSLSAMAAARPEDLDALVAELEPYGIAELQRTGRIAILAPA
jgi:acetolactate synthase I/III small subunit